MKLNLFNNRGETSSQTSTTAPWQPSQGFLKGAMNRADNLLDDKRGFNPYPQGSYTGMSGQTQGALSSMQGLASQPNPLSQPAMDFTGQLLGGAYTHNTSGLSNLYGQNPNAIAKYGTGIASGAQSQTALGKYGTGIASGEQRIRTEGDYRSMLGGENEAYNQVRTSTANALGDQIQRQFGGTSYGAPENADYITRGVGDRLAQMDSDNYYQRQGLQRGLLGDISGVQGQNINNRLNAAGAISGEQGQNLSRRLQAAGMLSGEQQTGFSNNRGLLGDVINANQMSIQNRMGAVGLMNTAYQSQYAPADRMAAVGAAYDADAQAQRQSQMDLWNAKQQAPWERLASAYGIFSGTGQQGQSMQTSTSQPTDPWSKIAGLGLLGGQMFSGGGPGGGLF